MSKRITDKERLDWLNDDMGASIEPSILGPWLHVSADGKTKHNYDTVRLAIDAAIRASRKKSARRGEGSK